MTLDEPGKLETARELRRIARMIRLRANNVIAAYPPSTERTAHVAGLMETHKVCEERAARLEAKVAAFIAETQGDDPARTTTNALIDRAASRP